MDDFAKALVESVVTSTRNITAGSVGSGFTVRTPDGWFLVSIERSLVGDDRRRWTGGEWFGGRFVDA